MMRALIVDDERLARRGLRTLLERLPGVEVVGEAGDGPGAIASIGRLQPDVVLLDIRMPGMDGFGVLQALPSSRCPAIIVVTAYDVHAVKAFEANAVDYLLKPVDPDRLRHALDRVSHRLAVETPGMLADRLAALWAQWQQISDPAARAPRLPVEEGGKVVLVDPSDIRWIEAGNYARLHGTQRRFLIRATLASLEDRLRGRFLRVSRSALVNLASITAVERMNRGTYVVHLVGGTRVRSSRAYREGIVALVNPHATGSVKCEV